MLQAKRIEERNSLARLQMAAIIGINDVKRLMSLDEEENKK